MKGQRGMGNGGFLQYPGGKHGFRSGEALLIRLKHQPHRALKLRLVLPQQCGGA